MCLLHKNVLVFSINEGRDFFLFATESLVVGRVAAGTQILGEGGAPNPMLSLPSAITNVGAV